MSLIFLCFNKPMYVLYILYLLYLSELFSDVVIPSSFLSLLITPEWKSAPRRGLWLHPERRQRELHVRRRHRQHGCLRIAHHQPQALLHRQHWRRPVRWRSGSWAHLGRTGSGDQGYPPGLAHGWPSGSPHHGHPAPTALHATLRPSQAQIVRRHRRDKICFKRHKSSSSISKWHQLVDLFGVLN